jgi:hypothetical protein
MENKIPIAPFILKMFFNKKQKRIDNDSHF